MQIKQQKKIETNELWWIRKKIYGFKLFFYKKRKKNLWKKWREKNTGKKIILFYK
jgi:hypothetical protein